MKLLFLSVFDKMYSIASETKEKLSVKMEAINHKFIEISTSRKLNSVRGWP